MKFTLRQKEAIAAVIAELCNAETVTGVRKMQCLNALLGETYGITNRTVLQAQTLTLEKAVDRIGNLDPDVRTRLLQDLEAIARADGSYSPEEGVLLEGLKAALVPQEGKTSVDCRIFSVRADRLKFDGRKATFIHPDKQLCDEDLRERIRNMSDKIFRHLDELVLLFYCFGYGNWNSSPFSSAMFPGSMSNPRSPRSATGTRAASSRRPGSPRCSSPGGRTTWPRITIRRPS